MAIAAQRAAEAAKGKSKEASEDLNTAFVNKEIKAVQESEEYQNAGKAEQKEMI
jgi:hypothetical protein